MRAIRIFDTTLRDGEQSPGCSMNVPEKVAMALQLEALGVDVIEAGFAITSDKDFEAIKTIAAALKTATVASLARMVRLDIDRAYEALKEAVHPLIHVVISTSDLHLKHKLRMTREQVLEAIKTEVGYAKTLVNDIEFSAEDASRSDVEFLTLAVKTAIAAGATVVNIPDTVGYATPEEMFALITHIRKEVGDEIVISVHCHNDLGLGTACTLAAVRAGANQVECTINGIGERAGNAALEEIVMGIKTRQDYYNCTTNINTRMLYRTSKLLVATTGVPVSPQKAILGANAFAHESGIHQHGVLAERTTYEIISPADIGIPQNKMVLGKHSGKHAFSDRLETLGYILTPEQLQTAFSSFKRLCDKKKSVSDLDIEALVREHSTETYKAIEYVGFVINSGNTITSTANVKLIVGGEEIERVATGDGPIDACFKAIDVIVGYDVSLENYTIQSVTEGVDALGEVVVKILSPHGTITGRGLSTDIIEASIKAYLNAINKLG